MSKPTQPSLINKKDKIIIIIIIMIIIIIVIIIIFEKRKLCKKIYYEHLGNRFKN